MNISEAHKQAVLVAHGQPSAPEPAEAALAVLAGKVQEHLPDWRIHSATLAATDRLEEVCDTLDGPLTIYPCFMSEGYFTRTVLPRRLGPRHAHVLGPLGLEAELPDLVIEVLEGQAGRRSWELSSVEVLLAAHGSARGGKAAEAARRFLNALTSRTNLSGVRLGFVEQGPFIGDAVRDLPERTLCLPFFAQEGDHVRNDIGDALRDVDFAGEVLPVIGELPGAPALIARSLQRSVGGGEGKAI